MLRPSRVNQQLNTQAEDLVKSCNLTSFYFVELHLMSINTGVVYIQSDQCYEATGGCVV